MLKITTVKQTKEIVLKPRFSYLHIAGLIGGILYFAFTETALFKTLDDMIQIGIYAGIMMFCTICGVQLGSLKKILEQSKDIFDHFKDPGAIVMEIERMFVILAAQAGLAWEKLNEKETKRIKRFYNKKKNEQKVSKTPEIETV